MNSKINFVDGVASNREAPKTFHIPSDQEKAAVKPGQFIKLGVYFDKKPKDLAFDAERFWLVVSENSVERQVIKGAVNNDLVFTECHGLKCDDVIEVPYHAVLEIYG